MAVRLLDAFSQYFSDGGEVLTDGQLRFLVSGTNDLLDTFSDINLANPNANPLPLLAGGRVPSCFGQNRYYKIQLEYTDGTIIQTFDPVGGSVADGEFGAWNNQVVYNKDQISYYNSKFWRSLANGNQDNEPGVDAGWAEIKFNEVWSSTVAYPINFIVQRSGKLYFAVTATLAGDDPATTPNKWQLYNGLPIWGSGATYAQYERVIYNGYIHVSQQNTNLNHTPSTSGDAWWIPEWMTIPAFNEVLSLSGGGTLTARFAHELNDSSTYTIPAANSVPAKTVFVAGKTDQYKGQNPVVQRSGADVIRFGGGTDTALRFSAPYGHSLRFVSNGSNEWSI
jgi:hypothetical protein